MCHECGTHRAVRLILLNRFGAAEMHDDLPSWGAAMPVQMAYQLASAGVQMPRN
jgi:hypothetical protein